MRAMVLIVAAFTVAALTVGYAQGKESTSSSLTTCFEDDPCWDWTVMGNHEASATARHRRECTARGRVFVTVRLGVIRCMVIPPNIRRATRHGFRCWIEQDADDRTGDVYLNWYCKARR